MLYCHPWAGPLLLLSPKCPFAHLFLLLWPPQMPRLAPCPSLPRHLCSQVPAPRGSFTLPESSPHTPCHCCYPFQAAPFLSITTCGQAWCSVPVLPVSSALQTLWPPPPGHLTPPAAPGGSHSSSSLDGLYPGMPTDLREMPHSPLEGAYEGNGVIGRLLSGQACRQGRGLTVHIDTQRAMCVVEHSFLHSAARPCFPTMWTPSCGMKMGIQRWIWPSIMDTRTVPSTCGKCLGR